MCPSARFFLCARCRSQVLVCRRCDRGQIYCGAACSGESRRQRQREANRRYAKTRRALHKNAQRQQRFRQRQRALNAPSEKKVTDQGSAHVQRADTLVREHVPHPITPLEAQKTMNAHCEVCGIRCSALVRHDYLLPHQRWRYQRQLKNNSP